MKQHVSILLLLMCVLCNVQCLANASDSKVDLSQVGKQYTPAKIKTELEITYSISARKTTQDSYIEARYDVDEQGKPFNFHFSRTSGTDIFEALLTKNLQNWSLQPAMMNGEPIVQRNKMYQITYYMQQKSGRELTPKMRVNFQRYYNFIRDLYKNGENEKFENNMKLLEQANIANFTESRQLYLLKNAYLNKTNGSIYDKIYTLEKALKGRPRTEQGEMLALKIKAKLFFLYAQNNQLRLAQHLYYDITSTELGKDFAFKLGPTLDEIDGALISGNPIQTEVTVFDTGIYTHALSRNSFSISTTAQIVHAELQCEDFNVSFDFTPHTTYTTPISWDNCLLQVQAPSNSVLKISEGE